MRDCAATVAIAIGADGRRVFVSLDRRWFSQVSHFPSSIEEAASLVEAAGEPILSHEQLVATYGSEVALVPIDGPLVSWAE